MGGWGGCMSPMSLRCFVLTYFNLEPQRRLFVRPSSVAALPHRFDSWCNFHNPHTQQLQCPSDGVTLDSIAITFNANSYDYKNWHKFVVNRPKNPTVSSQPWDTVVTTATHNMPPASLRVVDVWQPEFRFSFLTDESLLVSYLGVIHPMARPWCAYVLKYIIVRPLVCHILLCFSLSVARAYMGSRWLQNRPTSWENFPKHLQQNIMNEGVRNTVLFSVIHLGPSKGGRSGSSQSQIPKGSDLALISRRSI